ncbi:unnamed protein product [Rotaria magnacalcarata]|uniref:Uncharacterized protein n=3 Tax=Rotaria magnacalcarata TaxID=392030 RepID=A0A816MDQ3_9BILA|nr:unnamed protein product [Rotaria magnacalcarata]
MRSSSSFFQKNQNNSSSSSLENDSTSDQSDDDDDEDDNHRINFERHRTRTIQNDNNMLECPSDYGDSCSQSDDSNNNNNDDDDDEKENDLFTSSTNTRSSFLTRQVTLYEEDWPRRHSLTENNLRKPIYRGENSLLETEQDKGLFLDSNQHRLFPPERNKLVGSLNTKHQSRNTHISLSSDFKASTQQLHSLSELDSMQKTTTTSSSSQAKSSNSMISPLRTPKANEDQRRPISKIPVRTNSSSQSRSRSPAAITNRHVQSPAAPSKIPVPVPAATSSKGAFRFFTANDRASSSSSSLLQMSSIKDSKQQPPSQTNKKTSPFTPITQPKTVSLPKKISSSAGHTPAIHQRPTQLPSSDDDDSETNHLPEADLKLKLKEQKRHGKQTGELLNKLHENYEELLEKYAQAENTIDQLRFQPKILGDNTPPINSAEGTVHFIQQPKVQMTDLRSNGIYHSINSTPFSSVRQVHSITSATTTTTTRSMEKSASPSGTVESVFFDESPPRKIIVQELTTPETVRLDLLIQTKTLAEKMKSFITLMDANQLSLAEQKQVYENIKEDYEKLLKAYDVSKNSNDLTDIDFDADLNNELETMKQLLKEIVKRITDNLLGKSNNGSENGHLTREGSQLSQSSHRSSICNHGDLMNQYQKIMNAVNADTVEQNPAFKSLDTGLETGSRQLKKSYSRDSTQSDISNRDPPTTKNKQPCVYVSGNSDDDQQQISDSTPVPLSKGTGSASFSVDRMQLTSTKQYQQVDEEQAHIHGIPTAATTITKKKKYPTKQIFQEYDNLENITQSKRNNKTQQKKLVHTYQNDKELTPSSVSIPRVGTRCSASSMRTRNSDYDSGIGTNNTTKLSRDSKLNTSTMDESHYQSLDEERRRYSDEEQQSISNLSSPRSSGSGAASPGSPYSKYTKKFDRPLSSKQLDDNRRRKPSGHSDAYPSDLEAPSTGSFDIHPQSASSKKRSYYNLSPQRPTTQRSHSKATSHRSLSNDSIDLDSYKTRPYRPQTAPQISSKLEAYHKMSRKYRSGFIQQNSLSSRNRETMYKSSFYVDQAHTHRKSQEKLNQNAREYNKQTQPANKLYLDPQTGVIYRYIEEKTKPATVTYYRPTSQTKSAQNLYKCDECGSVTSYFHRHHIDSNLRRVTSDIDDPGYESGNRKLKRYRKFIDNLASSDSDSDDKVTHTDLNGLSEAFERARKVQERSQNLSKHISRQLKLVLSTI